MVAPGTPNPGSGVSKLAALYAGKRLDVLGVASGVSLAAAGSGPAFFVPVSNTALLIMAILDGFTAGQVDQGVTLSLGFTTPFTQLFSATLGSIIGKGISSVIVNAGGSGYDATTTVTFDSNDLGRGATGRVVLTGDAVSAIVVTNPGYGYVVAPTVTISGPGTLADATAVLGAAGLVPPQPIILFMQPNLSLIAGGFELQWAITNAVASSGACNITFLGSLI